MISPLELDARAPGPLRPVLSTPPSLQEIIVAAFTLAILLGLKWFYAGNQLWDSDEPQHLHVVWAWTFGLLPYRDVFDNHSPLFQALSASGFRFLR